MKQGKFPIEIWNVPGELGHTNKQTILRLDSKDNAFNFGRFMTISGHFFLPTTYLSFTKHKF